MNPPDQLQIEGLDIHRHASQARVAVTSFLDTVARFLEEQSWILLVLLLLPYLAYLATHRPLLWHDELYTYYIAQAPTFGQMIQETRTNDLNPPLSYILVRSVFKFLHPGTVSTRLPSMAAFFSAAIFLFIFVRRRSSPIYGALAALVLMGSAYKSYSIEARPYALVLCFLGVAAVGWQLALEKRGRRRWPGLFLLVLGGAGMLSSHVLATVAYGAFFVAELVRLFVRRKPDWPLWIALLLPLSCMALYKPLLENHGAGAFPIAFQASVVRLMAEDGTFWTDLAVLLAVAMVAVIVVRGNEIPSEMGRRRPAFTAAELVFAVYLLALPITVTVLLMRSHSAYFGRYAMPAVFGAGILIPYLLSYWTKGDRVAGLLAAMVFSFGVIPPTSYISRIEQWISPPKAEESAFTGDSSQPLARIEPGLPFVDTSGLTFLEMNNRESGQFLSRLYYLTDLQAAMQYSHATIFEAMGSLKHIFPIQGNVEPYQEFIRTHPKFLVYGGYDYPEDWLLRKLLADGATLRFLGNFPAGYPIFREWTLYEVSMPHRE